MRRSARIAVSLGARHVAQSERVALKECFTQRERGAWAECVAPAWRVAKAAAGVLVWSLIAVGAGAARADERSAMLRDAGVVVARLVDAGVPEEPLRHALTALECARARGVLDASTLTLIDYSRPSNRRRLWVLDLERGRVRFHELVAHGRNSGHVRSSRFSNVPGSRQSSLGLFRTAETYHGRHGYSLRLDGLEPGVNDLARTRAIVLHGAEYVTEEAAAYFGRVGRSWGCPAVDSAVHRRLIDRIRGGTAVFAYYPDRTWLSHSVYQTCETATAAR